MRKLEPSTSMFCLSTLEGHKLKISGMLRFVSSRIMSLANSVLYVYIYIYITVESNTYG